MSVAIVTGSAGLVGSEAVTFLVERGFDVVGIDNDLRRELFGEQASTDWNRRRLEAAHPRAYRHAAVDVRDAAAVDGILARHGRAVRLVIHAAAQPSHDWAARDPRADFAINAVGTLNVLEATRRHAPDAAFIFTSTNKVYGDTPNHLPLVELETRWEIAPTHPYATGIPEEMTIDRSQHSVFGASKVAADVMVQEYGRYFGLRTACFRGGCLTGPNHSGTELHGFLAYLMRCAATGAPYTVYGYGARQVRDNIHSADLMAAFWEFFQAPRSGEVYNMGGGRFSNCSMREAIRMCEEIAGRPLSWRYDERARAGDHVWWISDTRRFEAHYPTWRLRHDVPAILREIHDANVERWRSEPRATAPAA